MFSHQELNTPAFTYSEYVLDALENGKGLFDRPSERLERIEIIDNDFLPLHFDILMPHRNGGENQKPVSVIPPTKKRKYLFNL